MKIRKANLSDKKDLFLWRNNEATIKMSLSLTPISQNKHNKWLEDTLNNKHKILLISEENNNKISVVRFDIDINKKSAEISINLKPSERGKGKSVEIISKSIAYLAKNNDYKIKTITAKIKKQNYVSKSSFLKSGFELLHSESDVELYRYFYR